MMSVSQIVGYGVLSFVIGYIVGRIHADQEKQENFIEPAIKEPATEKGD